MKKAAAEHCSVAVFHILLLLESIFGETANGVNPFFGNILPSGAGSYSVIGITDSGVINISARTYISHI